MFVFKISIIFFIGLALGLFTTWEYFISFGVIFLFITFLVNSDENFDVSIYFIVFWLLVISFLIGGIISLKSPEDFPVITLLINIAWV